jgi:hypothetical protein
MEKIAEAKRRESQSSDGWLKFIISNSSVLRKARKAVGSGLHWHSLASTPVSNRVDVRHEAGHKNNENKLYRPTYWDKGRKKKR